MKKVLITGASGFIGRSLAKEYLIKGYQVYGVDIFIEGMQELIDYPNFISIKVENNSFEAINSEIVNDIDLVYHLGWAGKLGGPDLNDFDMQIANINMTKKLIEKMLKIGMKKFVFCGSISNYKFRNDIEEEVHSDIYGIAKKFAGDLSLNICLINDIECNVVLLANTFGIGDYSKKAVNTMLLKFINKENLTLIDENVLNDWVYIDDTVKGLIAVGEQGKNFKEYYIGHRIIPTFGDNLRKMKEAMNSEVKLKFGTYHDITFADYKKVDLNALYDDTGFQCECDIKDSLIKTAKWLLHQNELGESL